MNELLPGAIRVAAGESLTALEALSLTLTAYASFVLACKACFEKKPSVGVALFEHSQFAVESCVRHEAIVRIEERVALRKSQALGLVQEHAYRDWIRTGASDCERRYVEAFEARRAHLKGDDLHVSEAAYSYFSGRDLGRALAATDRISKGNPARSVNLGFLWARRGSLDKAVGEYRRLLRMKWDRLNMVEVESFVAMAGEVDGVPELYYAAGYLAKFVRKDNEVARGYFERYLASVDAADRVSRRFIRQAERWVGGGASSGAVSD